LLVHKLRQEANLNVVEYCSERLYERIYTKSNGTDDLKPIKNIPSRMLFLLFFIWKDLTMFISTQRCVNTSLFPLYRITGLSLGVYEALPEGL
jgi:hypothetical protein